jgi:hypothetical protein
MRMFNSCVKKKLVRTLLLINLPQSLASLLTLSHTSVHRPSHAPRKQWAGHIVLETEVRSNSIFLIFLFVWNRGQCEETAFSLTLVLGLLNDGCRW